MFQKGRGPDVPQFPTLQDGKRVVPMGLGDVETERRLSSVVSIGDSTTITIKYLLL